VPFFVASLFIINYYLDEEKKERDRIKLASQNASANAEMFRI
jgi:hypothetical protein